MTISPENVNGDRARVLVVEDDPASRRALLMLLKLNGFDTCHACNLAEAFQQLHANPSSVLLDLMLPDGNGSSVLSYIRSHRLPIRVAVTSGASNWRAMLGTGGMKPDAFFSKPLNFEQLMAWLSA